jgi:predicted extracellular nuclease
MMRWRTPSVALATALALGFSVLTAPAAFAATPDHSIADVQGTGSSTPLLGQTVTIEGVVTADYRGVSNFRGLFVQSAAPRRHCRGIRRPLRLPQPGEPRRVDR